jgi:hypothetical protein
MKTRKLLIPEENTNNSPHLEYYYKLVMSLVLVFI